MSRFIVQFEVRGFTRTDPDQFYKLFNTYEEAEKYIQTSDDPYLTWSNELWIKKVYVRQQEGSK